MKILVTGATGYIGKRLIPALLREGHEVCAMVRDRNRFHITPEAYTEKVEVFEADLLDISAAEPMPEDIDAAYYLVHSMTRSKDAFKNLEAQSASNFLKLIEGQKIQRIVYLSGISNEEILSTHLESRLQVEKILQAGPMPVTIFRAGIIVGSGSASFEIIRDLIEKLPVIIAPKWLRTKCQPISIRSVLSFLTKILDHEESKNKVYDIGGTEILSYKEMLLQYAEVRKLKRRIYTFPFISPRFSSYWLALLTSTNWSLARNLVDSLKVDVVCKTNNLAEELGIQTINYKEAITLAFQVIAQNEVVSSWKDSYSSSKAKKKLMDYLTIPTFGCTHDIRKIEIKSDPEKVLNNFMSIGGERGWYHATWLWRFRGFLDTLFKGVGLRRGRTHPHKLEPGDSLDFWRVLVTDKEKQRLLLYGEMKTPGEVWLEFSITHEGDKHYLNQKVSFRPTGIFGRIYWYLTAPVHLYIFPGMIRKIEQFNS